MHDETNSAECSSESSIARSVKISASDPLRFSVKGVL
jgi:hypothetical protein